MAVTSAEMTGADQTVGRRAGAASRPEVVSLAVILVTEVAVPILMDQVADGHQMMDAGATEDPVLAAVVVPEVALKAQGDLTAREKEVIPMRVTTVDGEAAASKPTSQRS